MTAATWAAAVAAAAGLAGCGEAPTCAQAVKNMLTVAAPAGAPAADGPALARGIAVCTEKKWSPELRTCVAAAGDLARLERCFPGPSVVGSVAAYEDYMRKSKTVEATLNLRRIERGLEEHHLAHDAFPAGRVAATPAPDRCCGQPRGQCAPDPALWTGPWAALAFAVEDPHRFSYAYESDGTTALATAIGDLDCDGASVRMELRCVVVDGAPACTTSALLGED